jgi:sec-independent protein translocase protein TatB
MTEVIIILGLALILLGPDQLPTIAKSIGKGMREIRKATDDLKSTFEQEMVRMDEPLEAPRALQSVTPVAPVVAAADGTTPVDPNAAPAPPADPASARAAARRSAAVRVASASMDPLSLTREQQAQLRLVPPAGAVAQGGAAPAASPAPAAPSAPAASPSNDADKGTP